MPIDNFILNTIRYMPDWALSLPMDSGLLSYALDFMPTGIRAGITAATTASVLSTVSKYNASLRDFEATRDRWMELANWLESDFTGYTPPPASVVNAVNALGNKVAEIRNELDNARPTIERLNRLAGYETQLGEPITLGLFIAGGVVLFLGMAAIGMYFLPSVINAMEEAKTMRELGDAQVSEYSARMRIERERAQAEGRPMPPIPDPPKTPGKPDAPIISAGGVVAIVGIVAAGIAAWKFRTQLFGVKP